ncbi:6-carboxyhexanoate--CoA ligase [Desulfuromonas versatilis]|uniref:6-carboxyhexanoate--CoA ligase n=1 Tax=Desulfuromonas versatilis TaxID=2802975 RepID=A0ABN6E056_9BACT|nr:6-carboxyhexanoate--CoA ligase [Desulfuromonas versatilis]
MYSIRMHASRQGAHLSGAERLGGRQDLESLAAALLRRALEHPRGEAEQIVLTVEALPAEAVASGRLPDLTTLCVADYRQGRQAALRLLVAAGVREVAASLAIEALAQGASPTGGNMRGAMLVDADSGERLEPDRARGVRASRMDLAPGAELQLRLRLAERGLDNPHVREALVLAAKVLSAPGVVAELCWSDDPDYTAGYVATPFGGYQRMPHLKPAGEERGGRAFFIRRAGLDLPALIDYLEHAALLITEVGRINGEIEWEN